MGEQIKRLIVRTPSGADRTFFGRVACTEVEVIGREFAA